MREKPLTMLHRPFNIKHNQGDEIMTKKENPIKKFFKGLAEKLDKKIVEKSKQKGCCCKNKCS